MTAVITTRGGRWMTPWGEVVFGQPRPDRGEVGHLMLTTNDYLLYLLDKARPVASPSCPTVLHSAEFAADGFHYAQVDFEGTRWRWRLYPARLDDAEWEDMGIWLGVWPD